jgi:SOS-response transcriptional repressor LexA
MASDRPSKKQQELLNFIDGFIKGNGYGPSYREVMRALGYKSVSTVAAHVDALIAKGYLRKGDDYSARSLEVVTTGRELSEDERALKWLVSKEAELRKAERVEDADVIAKAIELLDQKGEKSV